MAATLSLVVDGVDLTQSFRDVLSSFANVRAHGLDEALQLEVAKLRLCRWQGSIAQLDANQGGVQGANGALFKNFLGLIGTFLARGATADSPNHDCDILGKETGSDHWLAKTLKRLSQKHCGGLGYELTVAHGRSKREIPSGALITIAALIQNLEVAGLKDRLGEMRINDAAEFGAQREASEADIHLLKQHSAAVDPEFSKLLSYGGNRFVDTRVEGQASVFQGIAVSSQYTGRFHESNGTYQHTFVKDSAKVVQGNMYGYNPFESTGPKN